MPIFRPVHVDQVIRLPDNQVGFCEGRENRKSIGGHLGDEDNSKAFALALDINGLARFNNLVEDVVDILAQFRRSNHTYV